jgi:hypothetical protein
VPPLSSSLLTLAQRRAWSYFTTERSSRCRKLNHGKEELCGAALLFLYP